MKTKSKKAREFYVAIDVAGFAYAVSNIRREVKKEVQPSIGEYIIKVQEVLPKRKK
jgi:hypothetical protein